VPARHFDETQTAFYWRAPRRLGGRVAVLKLLAARVPVLATAPALLFVAVLMTSGLAEIDWDDITVAAPVVITALAMPFTYSIANGIAFGFIAWTAIKLLSGRYRELNPALVILSILFVIKLGWFNA